MQTPLRHFIHPPNIAHEGKECDHIGRRLGKLCWGGEANEEGKEGEGSKPNEKKGLEKETKRGKQKKG
jgi:hypothetical protein